MSETEFLDELYASASALSGSPSKISPKKPSTSQASNELDPSASSRDIEMKDINELEDSDVDFPDRLTTPPAQPVKVKAEPSVAELPSSAMGKKSRKSGRVSTPILISSDGESSEDGDQGLQDGDGGQDVNSKNEEDEEESDGDKGERSITHTSGRNSFSDATNTTAKTSAKQKAATKDDTQLPTASNKPSRTYDHGPSASQPLPSKSTSEVHTASSSSKSMPPPATQPVGRSVSTSASLSRPKPRPLSQSQSATEPVKKRRKLDIPSSQPISTISASKLASKPGSKPTSASVLQRSLSQALPKSSQSQSYHVASPSASVSGSTSSKSQRSDSSQRTQTSSAAAQVEAMLTSSPGPEDQNDSQAPEHPGDDAGAEEVRKLKESDDTRLPNKRPRITDTPVFVSSSSDSPPPSASTTKASNFAASAGTSSSGNTPRSNKSRGRKHPIWWLLDGSVIVQIHKTDFRLHRSRLVAQSTFFASLFGDPKSYPDGIVKLYEKGKRLSDVDGCPAYRVFGTGVSVRDFESLLEFMDNGYIYMYTLPPFVVLAAVLRASRALEFNALDTLATRKLRELWSSSLSGLTLEPKMHAAETVVLARNWDMPELLKRACYELVRTTGLGQDADDEDSDEDKEDEGGRQRDENEKDKTISRADLVRLIMTREKLHLEWFLVADLPPSSEDYPCPLAAPAPGSQDPSSSNMPNPPPAASCTAARARFPSLWLNKVKRPGLYEESMYDPLCGLERLGEIKWEEEGFCEGRAKNWREAWKKKREKLWRNLDLWLELPEVNAGSEEMQGI